MGEPLGDRQRRHVARWHRERFRRYWAKISRRRNPGRPRIEAKIRRPIRTMTQDGWGAPRIHAELTKLGFIVSEITVSRHITHFNATFHPTSAWVIQQLREAFPYDTAPRYLIFDRDANFSRAVVEFITAMGTKPIRISCRSPWQNGISSGSCACTSATTTRTAATWVSTKTLRMRDRSRQGRHPRRRSSHCHELVDCTIGTNGARLRSNVFGRIRGPES